MSMSVDLVLRLQSFQQLDHYFLGRYKLRVSVLTRGVAAKPYFVPLSARGQLFDECYETESFEAPPHRRRPLADLCAFRAAVQEGDELHVVVELLVSELDDTWTRRFPADARGFSRVDGGTLVVADAHHPLHHAAEITFEGHLWGTVRFTLHAVLIGFRPAVAPPAAAPPAEARETHDKQLRLLQSTYRRLNDELLAATDAPESAWLREKLALAESPSAADAAPQAQSAKAAELHRWSTAIYQLHMLLLEVLQLAPGDVMQNLECGSRGEAERLMALFHTRHEPPDRLWQERPPCFCRSEVAASYRKAQSRLGQLRVWQAEAWAADTMPVFFEERYTELPPAPASRVSKAHLFVLVHGFQGSEFDMRAWKNFIVKCYPDTAFLVSLSNQFEPRPADLAAMSANLAAELRRHLAAAYPAGLDRLSFLGHSLGGLVARGAVSLLPELHDRCFSYISLGTPHLGVAQLPSLLVSTGLKLYKGLLSGRVLHELDLTDAPLPQHGALARLAAQPQLCWFRHTLLVGSEQDGYCPLSSAHVRGLARPVERKMAQEVLTGIAPTTLVRLAVDVAVEGGSLDRVTGRAAHLALVQNTKIVQAVLHRYAQYFA